MLLKTLRNSRVIDLSNDFDLDFDFDFDFDSFFLLGVDKVCTHFILRV